MLQFVTDREIYTEVIQARLPQARREFARFFYVTTN